jgi:PAS domain-containing protein
VRSIPPGLARAALDAAPDAMVIIDSGGIICFANRQAAGRFAQEDPYRRSLSSCLP